MDDAIPRTEIRLREGSTIAKRLVTVGFAAVVTLFFAPGLLASDTLEIAISVFALLSGTAFILSVMFTPAVVWIITPDQILIGRQRPFGHLRTRIVAPDEIAGLQVKTDKTTATRFHLTFTLVSGERLTSPQIPDVTHVHETVGQIAAQFQLPDVEIPANPLDASNAEMRLGEPAEPTAGRDIRIITLIIAALSTLPYAYKLWSGQEPGLIEIIFLPAGAIAAVAFYRYAHLLGGTVWIIRQGEIRIERMSRNGVPRADTIAGGDIETIAVERSGRSEDERYIVAIRLLSGKRLRSPRIGSENEARAVGAEITRRLGIEPQKSRI
jgi:hypothetical protein